MNKLRLLVIEDDKDFRESYKKQIRLYNLDQEDFEIEAKYAENPQEAKTLLQSRQIDAAVVDLKLGNADVNYQGNEIVDTIKSNLRFPAFIVTANPEKIEEEKQNENDLFKIRIKGSEEGNFTSILDEFKKIHLTGITNILGTSGLIEEHLNNIFWNHISTSMDMWINDADRSPEEKQKTLLRYTLSHIQEYLELNEESGFEDYHPSEIYITPCIKPNVFTGDLVQEKRGSAYYIVLTPSCDLAQAKAKDILIVQIESPQEGILKEKVNILKKGKADSEVLEESKKVIKSLIGNSFSNKYHFLPKYREIEGGLINFQKMKAIRAKEFNEDFVRKASINSTFTKDIVARFSYYYSRQGSPDFDTDEVLKSLL